MSEERRSSRKSYSEAMNEWASTREQAKPLLAGASFSLFAPDPFAHPVMKFFGWLWRLGLLALFTGAVYYFLLQRHLGSKEFSQQLAGEVKQWLGATDTELSPLSWRGDRASIRGLKAGGQTTSLFRTLEAENVSFRVPFAMLWKKDWDVTSIEVGRLEAVLRAGGSSASPTEPAATAPSPSGPTPDDLPAEGVSTKIDASLTPEPEAPGSKPATRAIDLDIRKDGLGVEPSLRSLAPRSVACDDTTLSWGTSPLTRGAVRGAQIEATRGETGGWTFLFGPKGTLEQNWLRDLVIVGGKVRADSQRLTFDQFGFRLGEGEGLLTGTVALGETPKLDLKIRAERLPLATLVGSDFSRWVQADASGTLSLAGSTNLSGGVTTSGTLLMDKGMVRTLPVLDTLAVVSARVRFRQMPITRGEVKFTTGGGRLEVQSFAFQSEQDIVVQGGFVHERGVFRGEMMLGAAPELLTKAAPAVRERYFAKESAGKLWITIPLQGTAAELTSAQSKEMAALHEASGK